MAHGSKRWIRDYTGRIKRSADRTYKDWQGDLCRFRPHSKQHRCTACAAVRAPYEAHNRKYFAEWHALREKYGDQAWHHEHELRHRYVRLSYREMLCTDCRTKDRWSDWHTWRKPKKRWSRSGVPKGFRQTLNRDYRSKVRQAMREGRYDDLPIHKRNAAWLYW